MKRGAPLKTFKRIERRTPLRSTRAPFPSKGGASPVVAADATGEASLEALAFPKPSRARHPRGAKPEVEVNHGSRKARAVAAPGTDAQPLVALEGQQGLPLFPKPAPRAKAERAPLPRSRMKKRRARRIDRETPEEKIYKAWIHAQPCAAAEHIPGHACRDAYGNPTTAVEQSHERSIAKGSGAGNKLNNFESWSFCWGAARDWDGNKGDFNRWPKARRLKFSAERVIEANARFDATRTWRSA